MKKYLTPRFLVLIIWIIYLVIFLFGTNFFPFLKFDLYSRADDFNITKNVFLARPINKPDLSEDITSKFFYHPDWKFVVALRVMLRDHPEKVEQILKARLLEINKNSETKYSGLIFISKSENGELKASRVEIE